MNIDNNTQKVNLISAIPVVGQVIGIYTVALNTLKSGSAAVDYTLAWAAKKPKIAQIEAKERFIYHSKWIGVGVVRAALPVFGGLTLWATSAAPLKEHKFSIKDGSIHKIFEGSPVRSSSLEKYGYLLLATPYVGQILGGAGAFVFTIKVLWELEMLLIFKIVEFGNFVFRNDNSFAHRQINTLWESVTDDLVHAGQCLVGGALPVVGGLTLYGANAHAPNRPEMKYDGQIKKDAPQLNAEERAAQCAYPAKRANLEIIAENNSQEPVGAVSHEPQRERAVMLQGDAALKRACLVLGDTQILDSEYEGGTAEDAVDYWRKVIDEEDKNLDTFIEAKEKEAIFADFADMSQSAIYLQDGQSKGLVKYIYQRLEKRGRVVLTLRTRSSEGPGHVFGVVLEKKGDGSVSYYFLNKGEGSEIFPTAAIEEKPGACCRSPRYILDRRLFSHEDEKFDERFVKKLSGFTRVKPLKGEWNSTSLEKLFFAVSRPDPTDKIHASDQATPQRSGTCSDQLARMIIRDQLLQKNPNGKQFLKYKRVIASGKMEAVKLLASAKGPYKLISRLLEAAAHSFTKAFSKQRITLKELQFAKELISDVPLTKPQLGSKLPEMTDKGDSQTIKIDKVNLAGGKGGGNKVQNNEKYFNFHTPATLREKIRSFSTITGSAQENRFCLMRTLPIPVPNQANPEWDGLTEQEKEAFISQLKEMNKTMDWQQKEAYLFNLQSLVICDYLTRSMPSVKREGFSINPIIEGMQHKLDLQYGDTALRFEKLTRYFREVNAKKGQSDLFAFTNLSQEKFISHFENCIYGKWGGADPSVRALYNYLLQFKDKITLFNTETKQTEKERFFRLLANGYVFNGTNKDASDGEDHLPKPFRDMATLMTLHYSHMQIDGYRMSKIKFSHKCEQVRSYFGGYIKEYFILSGLRYMKLEKPKIAPAGKYFRHDLIQEKSENQIYKESESSVDRAFKQFDAYPELRIPYLIQWINQHPQEANSPESHEEIFRGFFRDNALLNCLRKEPAVRQNIEEMVLQQLNNLNPRSYMEALKWVQLGFFCETQADQAGLGIHAPFMKKLKDFVDQKIDRLSNGKDKLSLSPPGDKEGVHFGLFSPSPKRDRVLGVYFLCRANLDSYPAPWSEEQCVQYLINNCCAKFYDGINPHPECLLRAHENKALFNQYLSKNKAFIGESILKHLGIPCQNGTWISPYFSVLTFTGSGTEVQIDLAKGLVIKDGVPLNKPTWPDWAKEEKLTRAGISLDSKILVSDTEVTAVDGSFKIVKNYQDFDVYKKHPFSCGESLLLADERKETLFEKRLLWLGEKKSFVVEPDGTVAATIEGEVKNQKGEYLLKGLENSNLSRFLSASTSKVLFWGTVPSGFSAYMQNKKVVTIECRDLGLTFIRNGTRWESDQHKGYVLSETQGYLDGVNFPGALQLEKIDDPRQKKMILPAKEIAVQHPLDRDKYLTNDAIDKKRGYFEYDLVEKTGHFYTNDPAALLYLAYVYQSLGEYSLSMHYLDYLPPNAFDETALKILGMMMKHKDSSPEACAFLCKVMLKGLEGDKLTFTDHFQKGVSEEINKQLAKFFEKLTEYSHLNNNALPEALCLTPEEQKQLLLHLQSVNLGTTRGLGAKAYALSHTPTGPFLQILPTDNPILSAIINSKEEFKSDVSMTASYTGRDLENGIEMGDNIGLKGEFFNLFSKALKCQTEISYRPDEWEALRRKEPIGAHPFDLDLQTLWHCHNLDKTEAQLVKLLYLARHYPECFRQSTKTQDICDIATKLRAALQNSALQNLSRVQSKPFQETKKVEKKAEKVTFPPPGKEHQPVKPCEGLVKEFFSSKSTPVFQDPFALESLKGKSSLSARIFAKMKQAYAKLKGGLKVDLFKLEKEGLAEAIIAEQQKQTEKLQSLKEQIEKLANPKGDQKAFEQLDLLQKGKREISVPEVMLAVGTKNPSLLTKNNPLLDQSALNKLHLLAIKFMRETSRLDQLTEALDKIKANGSEQDVAVILNKTRTYDPFRWPELLFYEYSTGFLLRSDPDQANLLIDMFTHLFDKDNAALLKRIAFEFQAGGGKTKVISAILAAKAMGEGKMPVFFSLPSLFDVVRQDLNEVLSQVFHKNVIHLDIDLQHNFDAEKLHALNQTLRDRKDQGVCMVFTPETYHAMHLSWQRAERDNNHGLIKELSELLQLLKEEGLFLIDETHRNIDSLLQSNKAEGTPESINEGQRDIMIRAYQLMTDTAEKTLKLPNGRTVGQTLRIRENKQAQVPEREKKECLNLVCGQLIDDLGIPENLRDEAKRFVKFNNVTCPKELPEAYQQDAALIRGLYQKLLPSNLSKVGEMDYGPSIQKMDPVEAPRDQKIPTSAKFESADIAATLTCQGAFQRGVENPETMKKLLLQMQNEAKERRAFDPQEPALCKKFRSWQKSDPVELEQISETDLNSSAFLQEMIRQIGKEPEVIALYLRYLALPHVLHFPEKMTSTGADLVDGARSVVQFSATLGEKELYPFGLKDDYYWLDPEFVANVANRCCMPHNQNHHYFEPTTPKKLFEDLHKENPGYFDTVEGIIDVGYWSKGYSSKKSAEEFCTFAREKKLDYAGAIYFDYDEAKEKRLYFLPKDKKEPVLLLSTNLKREMARLGLSGKRLFKIYGADETTGTDLTLSDRAKMIVSIGENTTLSAAVQAVMRMRSFLKNPIEPENAQSTLWVLPDKIRTLIEESEKRSDVIGLFGWLTENEAKKLKSTILSNAVQDIQFLARHLVREIIRQAPLEKQHALYKKYRRCFEFAVPRDLMKEYGVPITEIPTQDFLKPFAKNFFLNGGLDDKQQDLLNKEAAQIIGRASALVEKMENQQNSLSSTARQVGYQTTVEEVKQLALQNQRVQGNVKDIYDYAETSDRLTHLNMSTSKNYSKLSDLCHASEFFPPNLFVSKNAAFAFSDKGTRKPFYSILIVEKQGIRQAAVVSNDDASHYLNQIREKKEIHAALFTPDGKVYQNGSLKIQNDPWFKEVMAAVNLTNGVLEDQAMIEKWVKEKPEAFRALWNSLKATSILKDAFSTRSLDIIYARVHPQPLKKVARTKVTIQHIEQNGSRSPIPVDKPLALPESIGGLLKDIPIYVLAGRGLKQAYTEISAMESVKIAISRVESVKKQYLSLLGF